MKCPKCSHDNTTVSTTVGLPTVVWRERRCKVCGHRWTTSEMADEPVGTTIAALKDSQRNGHGA